jgi:hypothetical protein
MSEQVTLPEVQVVYVESGTGIAGASEAFDRLESRFPSLKGRKFYGTFQRPSGPYRACTAIGPNDDVPALGLETWVIPGGKYSRRKLTDWQARIPEIGKAFQSMAKEAEPDPNRPCVEFYRSGKELVMYFPVK